MILIVVDGNDGTGKSTIVAWLRMLGHNVVDRGIPTKMTDDPDMKPNAKEVYFILDAPVEISRARLAAAGKDLNEKYHTVQDLIHYRERFQDVAKQLANGVVIDTSGSLERTQSLITVALRQFGL